MIGDPRAVPVLEQVADQGRGVVERVDVAEQDVGDGGVGAEGFEVLAGKRCG